MQFRLHQLYKNPMITLYRLKKKTIISHQYCNNVQNQYPYIFSDNSSSNESVFNQSIPYHENALRKSGFNVFLKNTPTQDQHNGAKGAKETEDDLVQATVFCKWEDKCRKYIPQTSRLPFSKST